MSPDELAGKHPYLYHLTDPDALAGIRRHGLLPTSMLLDRFEISGAERRAIERRRRPASVPLRHPAHGTAVITDNLPLSEAALAKCLDDELSPEDWLLLLNRRVFFWCNQRDLGTLQNAQLNRGRARLVLVLRTLDLVRAYYDNIELAPINTGSTIRRPARRGAATFTPIGTYSYRDWQRLRGRQSPDQVKEITVLGGVQDIDRYLERHYLVPGGA